MNYPQLSDCKIGFIGAGKIAHSIACGLIGSKQVSPQQISASAPTDKNLKKFKEMGCFTTNNNNSLFSGQSNVDITKAKVIFLCVKPDVIKKQEKSSFLVGNHLVSTYGPIIVISVLAGTKIEAIRRAFGLGLREEEVNKLFDTHSLGKLVTNTNDSIKFARIMPNTACSIGSGICGISREIPDQQFDQFLLNLVSPLGLCQIVPEQHLNAICGLGGSGIAFVYSFIHAMSDGAVKMGLPRSVATNFAAQTVLGGALMVHRTQRNPIDLRDEVTSPAGTTIYGLHELEKGAFTASIIAAIEAATKRADELS